MSVFALILWGDRLEVVNQLQVSWESDYTCRNSWGGDHITNYQIQGRFRKPMAAVMLPRHSIDTSRRVLVCGSHTWPPHVEHARQISVFHHRCVRSITRIWWQNRVSIYEVRHLVLGGDSFPLNGLMALHLRSFGNVLSMPAHCFHVLDKAGRRFVEVRLKLCVEVSRS